MRPLAPEAKKSRYRSTREGFIRTPSPQPVRIEPLRRIIAHTNARATRRGRHPRTANTSGSRSIRRFERSLRTRCRFAPLRDPDVTGWIVSDAAERGASALGRGLDIQFHGSLLEFAGRRFDESDGHGSIFGPVGSMWSLPTGRASWNRPALSEHSHCDARPPGSPRVRLGEIRERVSSSIDVQSRFSIE